MTALLGVLIPASRMLALWDTDPETLRITELEIPDIESPAAAAHRLLASAGASDAGWMERGAGATPLDTPLGLFASLAAAPGFHGRKSLIAALRAFAGVNGQGWAYEMLHRMDVSPFDRVG